MAVVAVFLEIGRLGHCSRGLVDGAGVELAFVELAFVVLGNFWIAIEKGRCEVTM